MGLSETPFKDALRAAINAGGGIVMFAKTLGVKHQAVYHWQNKGYVPFERAAEIERRWGIPHRLLVKRSVVQALDTVNAADLL
jgi:hypothetical protein